MVDDEKKKNKGKAVTPRKKIETMTHASAKPEVSDLIGQRLRNYYDEVAQQPVPDRFMELLNQLEAASSPKKNN
jgi:Anti-sigma factor NepR